jgi:hypothetical protein
MNMADLSTPQGTWYLKKWYWQSDSQNNIYTNPLTLSPDGISLNLINFTVIINYDSINNRYSGSIFLENTDNRFSYTLDQIQWNDGLGERNLVFCVSIFREGNPSAYEWYDGKIVEGVFVGRFSHLISPSRQPRFADPPYSNHVTGWNSEYVDQKDIVPRVYDIVLEDADYQYYRPANSQRRCRGLLRIDRLKNGHFIGRMKVHATLTNEGWDSRGEELEYDLEIDRWDGSSLHFIRRHHFARHGVVEDWIQEFDGTTRGRLISGQYRHRSGNTHGPSHIWHGERAQIFTYGLNPKDTRHREEWQSRTRRQLLHLTMADNPTPIVKVSSPTLPPFIPGRDTRSWATKVRQQNSQTYFRCSDIQVEDLRSNTGNSDAFSLPLIHQYYPLLGCVRDDNPPQNPTSPIRNSPNDYYALPYRIKELHFQYGFVNPPYNENQEIDHITHAWLVAPQGVPLELPPGRGSEYRGRRYPTVICLNGHGGSGWRTIAPYWGYGATMGFDILYYYGDSFARRGNFVVLAIDVSHRRTEDSIAYHDGYGSGDLPGSLDSGPLSIPLPSSEGSLEIDNNVYQDLHVIDNNTFSFSIKPHGFITSDWEQDGERAWDIIQGLNYLLTLPYVDPKCIIVAGLSMGGEMAAKVAALDPRIAMVISAGWSPDSGVHRCKDFPSSSPNHTHDAQSPLGHQCHAWIYANNLEYIDTSDYHALIAPRPLIVETGNFDATYSKMKPYYFSGDKTVTRRSRLAFQDSVNDHKFIHFMFSGGHEFHFGDSYPIPGPRPPLFNNPQYMRIPSEIGPTHANDIEWQIDSNTISTGQTVFDFIMQHGCYRTRVHLGDPFPYEVYCPGDCSLRRPDDPMVIDDPVDWVDRDVTIFLNGKINGLILAGSAVKLITVSPGTVYERYLGKTKEYTDLDIVESEKGEGFNGLKGCIAALQNNEIIKGIIQKEKETVGILSGKYEFKEVE